MTKFLKLIGRLTNTPLLCLPDYAEAAFSVILERAGMEPMVGLEIQANFKRPAKHGYFDKMTGVAVLPIIGGLAHRGDNVAPESGLAAYTAITNQIREFRDDYKVKGVLLDFDSPGGEVSGVAETAEAIAELAEVKPVYAIANGMMASAAYWLASAATRIYAAPNATVGSIGAMTIHMDRSKAMEKAGVKPTIIAAGKNKATGNPFEPLADDVRESVQTALDNIRTQFINVVAERRGLEAKKVRLTEAAVFSPEQAVELGLVDGIATFNEAVKALHLRINSPSSSNAGISAKKETDMTTRTIYGEDDLASARAEGEKTGASNATSQANAAAAQAATAMQTKLAGCYAKLAASPARMAAFNTFMSKGIDPDVALAAVEAVPEAQAAAPAPAPAQTPAQNAQQTLAQHAPQVQPDNAGNTSAPDDKSARMAELTGIGSAYAKAKGYR